MRTRGDATTTRAAIWVAAQRLFADRGYASTPLRDIASEAGVDPALIIRHFGSKEALFLDAMKVELENERVFDGPIESLGEHVIDQLLGSEERTRSMYLALLRASDSEGVGSRLREAHESNFVAPLRERLTGDDADLRARLAASLVGGLLYSLWVVGDEQLAATDHRELVTRYGAMLQGLITP